MRTQERWVLQAKKADFFGLAEQLQLDPVTVRLMVNRDVRDLAAMEKYIRGSKEDEYDPALMKGCIPAAKMLWEAIRQGEKILIASDFDVDGIFSGQILWEGIRCGGGYAETRAPHRVRDGYGVNEEMVRQAWADGFTTMITCDNGIAAFDAVSEAKRLGMRVIVTDHHQCIRDDEGEVRLPEADVIVNPHQPGCTYPFHGICGAGVAYKVMEMFFRLGGLSQERCDRFLEYTAIATVADVMDLVDENRIFVKEGLRRLGHTKNPGLRALIQEKGLDAEHLTSYHIGFVIGPCFNAAGRLDTVDRAFALLRAEEDRVLPLAKELKELNDSRKDMTVKGTEDAIAWVESRPQLDDILVIPLPDCHESIVGIVAGRIRERYQHPVFVLTKGSEGWKGSGRSTEKWDMFEGLLGCQHLLTRFGGHPMAAGLSLEEENIPVFREAINQNTGLVPEDFVSVVKIDVPMPLEYITERLLKELAILEPFGKGNPKPVFAESKFRIRKARVVGRNRNVLQMTVENLAGTCMNAVYFGEIDAFEETVRERYGERALEDVYSGAPNPVVLGLAYYPGINEYRGVRSIQITVTNIR